MRKTLTAISIALCAVTLMGVPAFAGESGGSKTGSVDTAAQAMATEAASTLAQALAAAYEGNPEIQAARAALRATDELYAQAQSNFRPTVNGVADYTSTNTDGGFGGDSDPKTLSVEVSQPLFRGFRSLEELQEAESKIKAQRAVLKMTEQDVLLDAVTAYMNVLRDKEIVELTLNNEKVLANHLKASRERFELGEVTKTDVSQAESRLADARANRVRAEGDFHQSRAYYERVIGSLPQDLEKPVVDIALPHDLDAAIDRAEKHNPATLYAAYLEDAARHTTEKVRGEKLPVVDLTGSVSKTYDPSLANTDDTNSSSIGVRATLPLYTAGRTYSRIREARNLENQRQIEVYSSRRSVREQTIQAWQNLAAASAEVESRDVQIRAAKLALDGVKVEAQYGSRTTLDVLDAEQEYLDALVARVSADHDRTVAMFGLLAAMGDLTAESLQLPVDYHDPLVNYQNVKNKWFGTDVEAE